MKSAVQTVVGGWKLELHPGEPRYVLTVYGVGYRFTDMA